jgi:hypothetical protein
MYVALAPLHDNGSLTEERAPVLRRGKELALTRLGYAENVSFRFFAPPRQHF